VSSLIWTLKSKKTYETLKTLKKHF